MFKASYHMMMLPGMFFIILFCYVPMFGIIMAFQDYVPAKGLLGSDWVGLKHFRDLFTTSDIWEILRNTVVISLGKIILRTFSCVAFAILLNEIKMLRLKKIVQTTVYLPHFLSPVRDLWAFLHSFSAEMP